MCDPSEDLDASGSCDVTDCQGLGATYDGTDFALSNQSCPVGDVVSGVDATGNLLCATPTDNDTTYSAGFGLMQSATTFSIDPLVVVSRLTGALQSVGTEVLGAVGTGSSSGAIQVTVADRNQTPDTIYTFTCMKVNLSVMVCRDADSGASVEHLTFSPAEQVMFSKPGFDLLTYLDGSSPFDASVIVRNTSGNSLFVSIDGGL